MILENVQAHQVYVKFSGVASTRSLIAAQEGFGGPQGTSGPLVRAVLGVGAVVVVLVLVLVRYEFVGS